MKPKPWLPRLQSLYNAYYILNSFKTRIRIWLIIEVCHTLFRVLLHSTNMINHCELVLRDNFAFQSTINKIIALFIRNGKNKVGKHICSEIPFVNFKAMNHGLKVKFQMSSGIRSWLIMWRWSFCIDIKQKVKWSANKHVRV